MPIDVLAAMTECIGFTPRDADRLRTLADRLAPHFPTLAERLVSAAARSSAWPHPPETPAALLRLHHRLATWVRRLCEVDGGPAGARRRARFGRALARLGVPQHLILCAVETLRAELSDLLERVAAETPAADRRLLGRALTLDLGLILESYRAAATEQVRVAAHAGMEARVARAERMAELGQLAAVLAHEIKNPLAGISGAIQVIRDGFAHDDPQHGVLGEVLQQVHRLDGTVNDLLTYARPPTLRFERCPLSHPVARVVGLLRRAPAFDGLQLEIDDQLGERRVEIDEPQIEQLLVNLLLNAAQASQPGAAVRLRLRAEQASALIEIEDRGAGMDATARRRAFEPFFTTKVRGTGLGLAICQRVVEAHGGSIRLHSRPGAGTRVEVRLPLCHTPAPGAPP